MSGGNLRKGNGARYRRFCAEVRARRDGCWICRAFGRDDHIDYTLPAGDPMAFEADHLVPVSKGGPLYDPANGAATHRRCNQWRGSRSVAEVMALAMAARGRPKPHLTTKW